MAATASRSRSATGGVGPPPPATGPPRPPPPPDRPGIPGPGEQPAPPARGGVGTGRGVPGRELGPPLDLTAARGAGRGVDRPPPQSAPAENRTCAAVDPARL